MNEFEKELRRKEENTKAIVTFIASAIMIFFMGWIAWLVYNKIAWEFNLPQLNYWVCTGATYVLRFIFGGIVGKRS